MAKETKELNKLENDEIKKAKKDSKEKNNSTKKVNSSTTSRSKGTKKSDPKNTNKNTSTKNSTTKKSATKTTTSKKSSTTKKATSTKSSPKATSSKKSGSTTKNVVTPDIVEPVEYYDLPYRYNKTVVKLLSQTPTNLFIYWDISDEDIENYKKMYGENFFEETKPVLVVHNLTLDYSFEVEINDFANSWYLHVNDSKCEYKIELGRRSIVNNDKINNNYVHITSSNKVESPNDRILFNNQQKMVYFRNVKTNSQYTKNISFIRNMGKIYNIYDLYQKIYEDEDISTLSNPSSSSSSFK